LLIFLCPSHQNHKNFNKASKEAEVAQQALERVEKDPAAPKNEAEKVILALTFFFLSLLFTFAQFVSLSVPRNFKG